MNFDNIQRLIDILHESPNITELAVTAPDGAKIALRRAGMASSPAADLVYLPQPSSEEGEIVSESEPGEVIDLPLQTVAATRVGIFHPTKPSLAPGARVSSGQVVGYIESMKLMNEVAATHSGTVVEVLVDSDLPVEYGQPLLRLSEHAEE